MTESAPQPLRRRRRRGGRRAALAVALIAAVVAVLRTQVFDLWTVASDSMSPTLCAGDTVVLVRLHGAAVDVDDIVTFGDPGTGESLIKRVVAVAGQTVTIEDARLTVDGRPVDEPWVDHATIDGLYFGPVVVPGGSVFVMGDHREVSVDSRAFGPIPVDELIARAWTALSSHCPG